MSNKRHITQAEIDTAAHAVAVSLLAQIQAAGCRVLNCHPVPRGGIPAFYAVQGAFYRLPVVAATPGAYHLSNTSPEHADAVVDDLEDSGATRERFMAEFPKARFHSLFQKGTPEFPTDEWLVMPWEGDSAGSIDDAFTRLLQFVGEDPTRPGLVETPKRMAGAWEEWTSGYKVSPADVLKLFEDGAEQYDEMVHVKGIPFYSNCEHHLAPFFGTVDFAYIPDKKIVGLSKMPRLVEVFARRLQVQERLTTQIIDTFMEHIKPRAAGITVTARHLCMESRGINRVGCVTTTNRFTGLLKTDTAARMEYLHLTTHAS